MQRPRFQGPSGGFEGFVPSKDPAQEVLAIMAEVQLASTCHTLVHGKSGFVDVIRDGMVNDNVTTIQLKEIQMDKKLQPKLDPQTRAEQYLAAIRKYYADKKKMMKKIQTERKKA